MRGGDERLFVFIILVVAVVELATAKERKLVLDGADVDAGVHVHVDGLHLRCVELEESEFGVDTVGGIEQEHVKLEVGHYAALCWLWLEIIHGMSADEPFERVFFVGCAFLAATSFHSFHNRCFYCQVLSWHKS